MIVWVWIGSKSRSSHCTVHRPPRIPGFVDLIEMLQGRARSLPWRVGVLLKLHTIHSLHKMCFGEITHMRVHICNLRYPEIQWIIITPYICTVYSPYVLLYQDTQRINCANVGFNYDPLYFGVSKVVSMYSLRNTIMFSSNNTNSRLDVGEIRCGLKTVTYIA